jgi:two-component system response regulator RstA
LSRKVTFKNQSMILSSIEFDLLWFLAMHPGEVKSRDDIFNNLKGIEYDGQSRAVDIHISQVRSKLSTLTGRSQWIKTIRGHGYIFNNELG